MKNKWSDLTVNDFMKLESIYNAPLSDENKTIRIVSYLSGKDEKEIRNLSPRDYEKFLEQIKFLSKPSQPTKTQKEYFINDHRYILKANITDISTAQYIDYQSIIKSKDLSRLVSIFLVPKGKDYNDGYDFEEVVEDVKQMKFIDANAIAFFLRRQLATFILILTDSSLSRMKKEKMMTLKTIKKYQTLFRNMASSLWLGTSAKNLIQVSNK